MRKPRRFKILAYGLCATLCIALLTFRIPFVNSVASTIAYPFLLASNTLSSSLPITWGSPSSHLRDLTTARRRIRDLETKNIELASRLAFFEETKESIAFARRYNLSSALLGKILLKELDGPRTQFTINKGSFHGVSEDMVAITGDTLLGKITTVYPFYSKGIFITDATCKIAACTADNFAAGIWYGGGSDGSRLEHVNHLETLSVDEVILSSGEGLIFPEGFGLGRLTSCKKGPICYETQATPLADIATIKYCHLIPPQKSSDF